MPRLDLDGLVADAQPGETVLAALLRSGAVVRHSCRAGACQSCLLRVTEGTPSPQGQQGLKDTLRERGYILSCITPADRDLRLSAVDSDGLQTLATLQESSLLSPTVLRLRLRPQQPLPYRAGQFIQILRDDGLTRSYSLASVPSIDPDLELHIRVLPDGRMSGWLATLRPGQDLRLRGPAGDCFYTPGNPAQPLVLVGTGTGLAPLWGIARDALSQGHTGPLVLVHGARSPSGLYYQNELLRLAQTHPALTYLPCVMEDGPPSVPGLVVGAIEHVLRDRFPKLAGWRVFLCGDPPIVQALRRHVFLAGAGRRDIFADAFVPSAS